MKVELKTKEMKIEDTKRAEGTEEVKRHGSPNKERMKTEEENIKEVCASSALFYWLFRTKAYASRKGGDGQEKDRS